MRRPSITNTPNVSGTGIMAVIASPASLYNASQSSACAFAAGQEQHHVEILQLPGTS